MKTKFTFLLGGLLAVAGFQATAATLQRTAVPAAALWVAHADCDGLRPTMIGQYLLAEMDKPEAQARFASFQAIFSFDPRKQLHGLTLFSTGSRPEDPVLLLYADFDPERLVTLAKGAKDCQTTTHNRHVIYNWVDDKKPAKGGVQPRIFAAISGRDIVIFGQREAPVAEALDVLDHAAPSLADGTFPRLGAPGDSSLIEAATQKLDAAASDPNAAIFRMAKLLQLQIGETGRRITARLTLEANDEAVAKNMASAAQGLVAVLKLQPGKPELLKLAEALALMQDGPVLTASLTLPAEDVLAGIKTGGTRKAAPPAEKQ